MREAFLDKNRSIYSVNKESNLNLTLTQKGRLYPFEAIQANIDRYQLYNEERDASNDFRLIFTINPICSNVLFNMRTEIVKNEGSVTDCKALVTDADTAPKEPYAVNSENLSRFQAIMDTEYTHPDIGKWVYHCGLDIFNNHKLRSNAFIYISKVANMNNTEETKYYNTMYDYKRDRNGETIEEVLIDGTSNNKVKAHVYQLDNILTFQEAVQQNLTIRNGWYGFTNPGSIEIPNGRLAGMSVNKMMNNNKACEVYNMYPDISLFSFIPKYNSIQQRTENNWEYCLTYPYANDIEMFKTINNGKDGILFIETGTTNINLEQYHWFKTKLPHNLLVGEYVRLYTSDGKEFRRIRVDKIGDANGDDKANVFMVNFNGTPYNAWYMKKDANGLECKYYFRLFRRIKNADGTEFSSDLSRLAFGENIYGDRLAQLTFLDTINLDNLVDNLGRPLSEIYLTILKTNKGWEQWYKSHVYNSSDIEFSHCFGPITSGLDLPKGESDYNIHKIYNRLNGGQATPKTLPKDTTPNNTAITMDGDFFYGDIVEFNPYEFEETTISKVYYRFNTAQRELNGLTYKYYNLETDDYDANAGFKVSTGETTAYKPEGYYYQPHYKIQLHNLREEANRFLAPVIKPLSGTTPTISKSGGTEQGTLEIREGYGTRLNGDTLNLYRTASENSLFISTTISTGWTAQIIYGNDPNIADGDIDIKSIKITAATDYDYYPGDVIGICKYNTANTSDTRVYWGTVSLVETIDVTYEENGEEVTKTYPVLTIDVDECPFDDISVNDEFALTDGTVPQYAIYNPIQQTFIWKDVLLPSETPSNMSTADMPFSNGAFYIHQNLTFFVRRQDPFGDYGLQEDNFDYSGFERYEGETEDEFKLRVNPDYLSIFMVKERQVVTDLVKYAATEIINSCL